MISSYTSYIKKVQIGGVAVGDQSLQDIFDFSAATELKPECGDHDACSIDCVIDSQKPEPFFSIDLSTRRLLRELDSSRPFLQKEALQISHPNFDIDSLLQASIDCE